MFDVARRLCCFVFRSCVVAGGRGGGVGARCLIRDGLDCRARDGQADYEHPGCHVVYAANRHAVTAEKLPDSIVYDDQAVSSVFFVQCFQNGIVKVLQNEERQTASRQRKSTYTGEIYKLPVLDCSQSARRTIQSPQPAGSRVRSAKKQLLRSLRQLEPGQALCLRSAPRRPSTKTRFHATYGTDP